MNNIKINSIVELVIPEGRELKEGSYKETGFRGALVSDMVRFLKSKKQFKVKNVNGIYLHLEDGEGYSYDKTWFRKVNEKPRKEITNVQFIKNKEKTIAIIDDEIIGKTVKNPKDENIEELSMILSLARALKVDKKIQNKIIDAFFKEENEQEIIENISSEKIMKEICKRLGI